MLATHSSVKTIGLITPSSPLFPGRLKKSVDYFGKAGFSVEVGKHNTKSDRFLAGTDEQRASDIMRFFEEPSVDLIVVTGGGAGSIRTLPLLDIHTIEKNKKPILGFSDTTSLQLGLYSQTNLVSYTGFTCRDIAEFENINPNIASSLNHCLTKTDYSISGGETINPGNVTGILVGGNLSCLCNLIGTPFQPDFKEKILLIEDVASEPYVLDGLFSQLYLSGIFNSISGLIIGQFMKCEAKFYPERDGSAEDVINDWTKKINVPCINQFPYGHFDERHVIPIGVKANLDAKACCVNISFNSD